MSKHMQEQFLTLNKPISDGYDIFSKWLHGYPLLDKISKFSNSECGSSLNGWPKNFMINSEQPLNILPMIDNQLETFCVHCEYLPQYYDVMSFADYHMRKFLNASRVTKNAVFSTVFPVRCTICFVGLESSVLHWYWHYKWLVKNSHPFKMVANSWYKIESTCGQF